MPSSDLILNVKQIAGYPSSGVQSSDEILLQRGGLGGPYMSLDTASYVSEALLDGSAPMQIGQPLPADAAGAQVSVFSIASQVGALWYWNGYLSSTTGHGKRLGAGPSAALEVNNPGGWSFYWSPSGSAGDQLQNTWTTALQIDPTGYLTVGNQVLLGRDPMLPMEAATSQWVQAQIAASTALLQSLYSNSTVWSFNRRTGNIILNLNDVMGAGGAPIWSPQFAGQPTAPSPAPASNDNSIATTQWVWMAANSVVANQVVVSSFNGRTGAVVLQTADVSAVMGNVLSPYAPLASPAFSGIPTAPTAGVGSNTGQLATTAFVTRAVQASTTGVSSFNTRTGAVVLTGADITSAGGALTASPSFTGTPLAPTATVGTSNTQIATTAFVAAAVAAVGGAVVSFNGRTGAVVLQTADITSAGGAALASPAFTGTPTAPTATAGTSNTQLATTAFVASAITNFTAVTSFNSRTGAVTLQANDLSAAGGALLANPAFTGTPTAPTAAPGTNTTQLATTQYVQAALGASGVTSFNTRTGAVTLTGGDLTAAGGALLASPIFTGSPSAPTASPGTSTTQLATTAFVAAAIAGSTAGVSSFNTRTGAVTLQANDISGAGGALLASPTFTGIPAAPTAAPGTNTTQLATTAYVMAQIAASGVSSFNTRTGAVTLTGADITGAGGALLASPSFTGTPSLPTGTTGVTQTAGTSSTALATTAFVQAAIRTPASVAPLMDGTAAVGTSLLYARQDHVHPHDTTLLPLAGGVMTGGIAFNLSVLGTPTANNIAIGAFTQGQDPSGWGSNSYTSLPLAVGGSTAGYLVRTIAVSAQNWPMHVIFSNNSMTAATAILQTTNAINWSVAACDARVKQDLAPAEDALAAINSIPVYSATYARPGLTFRERWSYTLLAQQVRDVLPHAYMEPATEEGYASLHPLHLIAALWKAVQQLTDRVHALEARA